MTIRQIYDYINTLAPFETQASFDNAGILVGDPDAEVVGIHVAMDVTDAVLDEAEAAGANLLVTHHPMMLDGRRNMCETDTEGRLLCRMIRNRMGLIACHTNLDQAAGGINEVLARRCGLTDITGEGYSRMGRLPEGETAGTLPGRIAACLNTTVRVMGQMPPDKALHTMVVASGAGSGSW